MPHMQGEGKPKGESARNKMSKLYNQQGKDQERLFTNKKGIGEIHMITMSISVYQLLKGGDSSDQRGNETQERSNLPPNTR